MKKALLLLAFSGTAAFAQVPAPAAQTQPDTGTTPAPVTPAQGMGAPVPETNAPPTQAQTSGLLTPPAADASAAPATPSTAGSAPTTTTTTAPSSGPSGLLAPPPDNAATSAVPAPASAPAPAAAPATTDAAAPPSTSHRMTRSEIVHIEKQEIVRRQEMVYRADQSMTQARKDELAQRYPAARAEYLFSAEAYGSISRNTDKYHYAAAGLERVDFALYDAAVKAGDTARAKMLADEVVDYNPNDKLALERQARTNQAINDPNDTGILGNPAVTPGLVKRVNEVQDLFAEAEQFRRTGQYDEAEARLKRILGIDPYNMSATKALERIVSEKNDYYDHARTQMREERLRQVEETWYEPITNKDNSPEAQEPQQPLVRQTNFDIDQRLKSIMVTLDFTDVSIEEATDFLYTESKRLDVPAHKGIPFIISPEASASAKPITLSLNNVPVSEALRYICQLANVKYKVQDYAISIVPFNANIEDLISREFIVPPTFVQPQQAASTDGASLSGSRPIPPPATPTPVTRSGAGATANSAQAVLEDKGVKFPPGASAVYTPTTNTLTVVDTADQMELIEALATGATAPTLMVRIATKFVEVNQEDLQDLTVNTTFNNLGLGTSFLGIPTPAGNGNYLPRFGTSLPGASGFTPDSIDNLISPLSVTSNTLAIGGTLGGMQYDALISALSQKRSFDLLSEPTALAKSGEQATMDANRVFPYPVAFDPPELVTETNTGSLIAIAVFTPPTVIATTPTDFKRRDIGVRLVIKPQVTSDNKTVDLALFPEVTDFEGFINYGSAINIGNPDGTTSLLSTNAINQPVFNSRRVTTRVLVRDGSTVVLGGLIREDLQTINDRVPIIGDIPLIGRLFQSKATQTDKRNLIIFVTANIYQNDGELLNPPEVVDAVDVLTGHRPAVPTP